MDICHLYVTYASEGYGDCLCERISLNDINPQNLIETDEEDRWDNYEYVSGYAEKQPDGTILINFSTLIEES